MDLLKKINIGIKNDSKIYSAINSNNFTISNGLNDGISVLYPVPIPLQPFTKIVGKIGK